MLRIPPAWCAFGGSVLLLAVLCAALRWDPFAAETAGSAEPIIVWCAEALRLPVEATARDFERVVGRPVVLRCGASLTILTNLQISRQGDLFLPADDSFIELAQQKDAIAAVLPLAKLTAVAVARPGYDEPLRTWSDVVAAGHSLGIGNESTALGKLMRRRLTALGLWTALQERRPAQLESVNAVANAVQLGSVDVGVVWDAVALQRPKLRTRFVHLPELDQVQANVQIALTRYSTQPAAALRFVAFMRAPDGGGRHFQEQGYAGFASGAVVLPQ